MNSQKEISMILVSSLYGWATIVDRPANIRAIRCHDIRCYEFAYFQQSSQALVNWVQERSILGGQGYRSADVELCDHLLCERHFVDFLAPRPRE